MGGADGDSGEADGDRDVLGFVPFEEPREGGHFDGVGAGVDPATGTKLTGQAEAKGPGVGGGAALVGLGGFNGEERGVAACEDVGDFGLLGATGVEFLGGKERRRVDGGGFSVEGEAELAGGVVAEGKGAAFGVTDEAVVVACRNLLDGKTLEGCDLVRDVESSRWSMLPRQTGYATLTFAREVLRA